MAKVTMQDIADALGVSRISVWKVFNNSNSVSSSLKERVLDKASELGYEKMGHLQEESLKTNDLNIAVVVSRPESSRYWSSMIHSIAEALTSVGANLLYVYLPSSYEEGYQLPDSIRRGLVNGMIVLNVYDRKLLELLNTTPTDKVFLDLTTDFPFIDLTGNLVLIDGKHTTRKIVDHVIEDMGLKRLGFVGDTRYALTNKLRYEGYVESMRSHGLMFEQDFLFNDEIGIYEYYNRISGYLDSLEHLPEAFVCVSDFVASFIYEYFRENPKRLTSPILVTGFDGSMEYPSVAGKITTAKVDTVKLGNMLAGKLINKIRNKYALREVSYVFPEVILHDTFLKYN